MANTISPNMGLVVPGVGSENGPNWATDLNFDLSAIDQHNHSTGQGVQIQPNGLNINADLPFNQNNATLLRTTRFFPQTAVLTLPADIGEIYVVGNELYYNDVTGGHQIQITNNGSVNAGAGSISGLPSGTASATYSAGTFIWQSATSTAANMDFGSAVFRNSTANSKGLTLSPPSAMAANFSLTLPSLPVATSFMQMDTSGNMSASVAVANGITRSNLAAVGQQISSGNSGNFLTNSGTFVQVTNLTITITTSGRPVLVFCQPDSTNNGSGFFLDSSVTGGFSAPEIGLFRGATQLANFFPNFNPFFPSTNFGFLFPPSLVYFLDTPSAGTYTYTVRVLTSNSDNSLGVLDCVLVAYEL